MDTEKESSAVERLASDPSSRRRFLAIVGGTGAAGALATVVAACGDDDNGSSTTAADNASTDDAAALAEFGKGDIGILNYALTLEYLETSFYEKAIASGVLSGGALSLAKEFGKQEAEHVDALTATVRKLGGKPAKAPETEFPLDDQMSVLDLASTVENLGAAAYLGQAPNIKSKEVLAAALSIHSVEGRHASALNSAIGKNVEPDGAFAQPAGAATVLEAVKPYIVS